MSLEKQRHIPEFDNAPSLTGATFDLIAGNLGRLTQSPASSPLLLEDRAASANEVIDELPGDAGDIVGRVYTTYGEPGKRIREYIEAAYYDPKQAGRVNQVLNLSHPHAKLVG